MKIADLGPYAEYKESELPWLGRVPAHWGLVPNRGLVRRRKVLVGKQHADYRLLSLTKQGIIVRDISTGRGKFSSDMGTSQEVRSGDLVFCLFDVPETPRTVGLSRHEGMITGAYTVFESLGRGSAEYFELFYRAMDDRKLLSPLYSGLRKTIPAERLLGTKTPQPPPAEQAAIVRFLDWTNGRLERAIRAKRKVIALLNEQKQAVIHRAVTRGLDPSVRLKHSGIRWLGDIPQHWEVRKLKHLTRFVNGLPFKPGDWKATGVPIIRIQNLNGSEAFNYTDRADLPEEMLIQPGDLMFAWSGNRGTSFGSFEWTREFPGYLNQHIFKLVGYTLPKRYFYYLLRAVTRHVEEQAGGIIGLVHVTKPELGSVQVPIAPADEAEALAREIDTATAGVERAISRLEREIDLLSEYRTRLVADVVTGKLDVREAAARLPNEAPLETVEDDTDLGDEAEAADEDGVA